MIGIVENIKAGHFFIRDEVTWARYFALGSECRGTAPAAGTRVEFSESHDDPRGPRAINVVVIGDPEPDIVAVCRDCAAEFAISAGTQVWYRARGLHIPTRCGGCRQARRAMNQ